MAMPARPGAGLVLVQPHVAFLSLELRFYTPPGASNTCQDLQESVLRGAGQVVAGLAAVQIPAINGSVDFAGLPPAGYPHPLSAVPIDTLPLASLGQGDDRQYQSCQIVPFRRGEAPPGDSFHRHSSPLSNLVSGGSCQERHCGIFGSAVR